MSATRVDPTTIIRLLRRTETPRYQAVKQILSDQLDREVDRAVAARRSSEISEDDPEPEVCDLCGEPPGPGHEACNRAIEAGLD